MSDGLEPVDFSWYRALARDRRELDILAAIQRQSITGVDLSRLVSILSRFGGTSWIVAALDRGASLEIGDEEGNSPLYNCVLGAQDRYNTFDTFVNLLRHGADPNGYGDGEVTLLQLAIEHNKPEYAVALLGWGADPLNEDRSFEKGNALTAARRSHRQWAIDLLQRWERGNTAKFK